MKKLMLTAAACAAMAFGAKADISVDELTKDLPDGWGYALTDLGAKGDEVALVFTNTQAQTTWTAPMLLAKVEYLVVGGGGSGGASGNAYGGGGGGAGQVRNDNLLAVAEGTDFVIDVGAGGAGVSAQNLQGNGGVRSQFAMGGRTFEALPGAGGGKGASNGSGGSDYACGGGGGGGYTSQGNKAGGAGVVSKGGTAYGQCGAGGGGAGGDGQNNGMGDGGTGVGGPGVATMIFGDEVRIAGGGSGNKGGRTLNPSVDGGGSGGMKDSYGNYPATGGTSWGAGGGGAANSSGSGSGHQGVVVLRFSTTAAASIPVAVPTIAGKTYTGETLTADIEETYEYEVVENNGGVNAGTYPVVLRLKAHDPKYVWDDGEKSEDDKTLDFVISKAANSWATAPALSKTAWRYSDEPATVTAGVSKDGKTAVVTYDDGLDEMPTSVGGHTATFTVAASDNYEKLEAVIGYTVNKDANVWTVEPSLTKTTWAFGEPTGEIVAGTAKYGDVGVTYEDNPVLTELPTSLGEHWVTFTVNEGDTYEALSKKVYYTVTKKINGWATPPVVLDGNIEDGLPAFTPPTAKSGGKVTVCYDGNPEIAEPPTAMGNHTVTYTVAEEEGEDGYQGYTQTIAYKMTYKMVYDQANPSVVCGYRLPWLGANSNEVAVVFTNTTAGAMTFTLPKYVSEISYLVVGGGASGGSSNNGYQGGGGGAGGVITNEGPYAVKGGSVLSVSVGARGEAVLGSTGKDGKSSSLSVGDVAVAAALPGAGGGGGAADGRGGSSYACGGGGGGGYASQGTKKGGTGATSNGGNADPGKGAGGGGAGGDGALGSVGGAGGPGVTVTIFVESGSPVAGGGCGSSYGNKGKTTAFGGGAAESAATSWGSGGGGAAGSGKTSGAGYQGVVVVRYVEEAKVAVMPAIPETMYTGERQVAQLVGGQGYEVVANEGGVEAGTNDVVIALAEGYSAWEDGVTDAERTLGFVINKADHNEWNPEPSISKDTWTTTDEEPGVLTAGRTTFGPVTATYTRNGVEQGAFDGTLPEAVGTYVITYMAPDETDSYVTVAEEDRVKTVEFMIVMENAVAKVGDYDTYETVADAFAAAKDGDTVLMLKNATVVAAVEVTNDVTLVLAGYEVAAGGRTPDTLFVVKEGATLTINGSAEGSLLAGGVCVTSGTLNLANTKVVATGDAIVDGAGNVTLNLGEGADVTSTGGYAIRETYADTEPAAVHAISVKGGMYSGALGTFVATDAFDAALAAGTATCAFEKASYTKPIDAKYVAAGRLQKKLADGTYCIGPAADTEALTYTWNGNGDTNLWQAANWSINKTLAPDAYVGFPNNFDLATAMFSAGAAPIEVGLADNVGLKKCVFDAGLNPVMVDLAGRKLKVNKSGPDGGNQIAYSAVLYANQNPVTFKNGEIDASGCFWFRGDDTEVVFDNVDAALPVAGLSMFAFRMLEDARMNSGVRSGCKVRIRNGSVMSGGLHLCSRAGGNCSEFIVDNSKWSGGVSFSTCGSGFLIAAQNGGSVSLGEGWWELGGSGYTLRAEGTGSKLTVNCPTGNAAAHDVTSVNTRWEAVDGGAFTFNAPTINGFDTDGNADRGNVFFVSNGTMTVNRKFKFGVHTDDARCVSPTIALAGNSPRFTADCAFTFGSDALELANPPVLELMPAPGGFAEPAISTTKKDDSLTIGSNVVVRVDVSDLKAHGAIQAKMALAAVPADGELKVDLDQLAANTTVNDDKSDWKVTYKLSERDGRKVLTARVSSGGFAVIVR